MKRLLLILSIFTLSFSVFAQKQGRNRPMLSEDQKANIAKEIQAFSDQNYKERKEFVEKIFQYRLKSLNDEKQRELAFLEKIHTKQSMIKFGNKEENKKIREEIKQMRNENKRERKQRIKELKEKLKQMRKEFSEKQKQRRQELKNRRKSFRK